jgi:hypothetical protein
VLTIVARDANYGARQVAYDPGLCFFKFTGGQCSLEVRDVVIASCVVRDGETSTAYKIDIPAQWNTMVSQDVNHDEDKRSFYSQASPLEIEGRYEIVVPEDESKVRDESDLRVNEVRLDMPSPFTPVCRKSNGLPKHYKMHKSI